MLQHRFFSAFSEDEMLTLICSVDCSFIFQFALVLGAFAAIYTSWCTPLIVAKCFYCSLATETINPPMLLSVP